MESLAQIQYTYSIQFSLREKLHRRELIDIFNGIEIETSEPVLLHYMGMYNFKNNKYDRAEFYLQNAVSAGAIAAYATLASLYFKTKKIKDAYNCALKAVKLGKCGYIILSDISKNKETYYDWDAVLDIYVCEGIKNNDMDCLLYAIEKLLYRAKYIIKFVCKESIKCFNDAYDYYIKCLKLNKYQAPYDITLLIIGGCFHYMNGNYENAVEYFRLCMSNKYAIDSNYEVIEIENDIQQVNTCELAQKTFINLSIKLNDKYNNLVISLCKYINNSLAVNVGFLMQYATKHNYNILNQTINEPIHAKLQMLFQCMTESESDHVRFLIHTTYANVSKIRKLSNEIELNKEIDVKQRKYKNEGNCSICMLDNTTLIPYNWCGHELCIGCYKILKAQAKPCPFCRYD
jgi:hypothetical protein